MTDRDAGLDPHLNDRPWERAGASTAPLLLWLFELNTIFSRLVRAERRMANPNGDAGMETTQFGCTETLQFRRGSEKPDDTPAPALIGHSVSGSRQIRTAGPKETNNNPSLQVRSACSLCDTRRDRESC